jgi:LPXTG-motif cell wall-anchored protein
LLPATGGSGSRESTLALTLVLIGAAVIFLRRSSNMTY